VLVVEDNSDLRDTLVTVLELMGHTISTADCGRRAVEIVGREKLDLALIDIGLPDIDGYEVARLIRGDPATKNLRLVALSGYATSEHRERAMEAGFDIHLAKPVDPKDILTLLWDVSGRSGKEL
jgi:CheY-like chemotaxis protein